MEPEQLKGHLDAMVLAVLAAGPRHGYAVIEELRTRSGGRLDLPEGTVYPALHRLERNKLLASEWSTQGRRRRVYRLTAHGERELGIRRRRWREFTTTVESVLATTAQATRATTAQATARAAAAQTTVQATRATTAQATARAAAAQTTVQATRATTAQATAQARPA